MCVLFVLQQSVLKIWDKIKADLERRQSKSSIFLNHYLSSIPRIAFFNQIIVRPKQEVLLKAGYCNLSIGIEICSPEIYTLPAQNTLQAMLLVDMLAVNETLLK